MWLTECDATELYVDARESDVLFCDPYYVQILNKPHRDYGGDT